MFNGVIYLQSWYSSKILEKQIGNYTRNENLKIKQQLLRATFSSFLLLSKYLAPYNARIADLVISVPKNDILD